jgi:poly(hydroxyalkanoate) granule-associated protein
MGKKKSETKLPNEVVETANRIWLAGLGALSTAEAEGTKAFKKLVAKGKDLEGGGLDRVRDQMDKARDVAESAWDGLASSLDDRVADVLHRLGVPTREEIQKLTDRVEALTAVVDRLKTPAAKTASTATKAPARKASAPKARKTAAKKPTAAAKATAAKATAAKATAANTKLTDA